MSIYRYVHMEENLSAPDIGDYKTYAIHAFEVNSLGEGILNIIHDVACDDVFVKEIAELCTQLQLAPCHLMDVILDNMP